MNDLLAKLAIEEKGVYPSYTFQLHDEIARTGLDIEFGVGLQKLITTSPL